MGETVIGPKAAEWLWDRSPTPWGGTSKGIRFLVYSSRIFQAQTQVYGISPLPPPIPCVSGEHRNCLDTWLFA